MNSEEKLSRLLRLTQHEQPPEGYFEEFLADFQKRQRRDLLKRGLWSMMGEKATDFFAQLTRPRFLVPAAVCYAAVLALLVAWPHAPKQAGTMNVVVSHTTNAASPVGPVGPQNRPLQQVGGSHLTALPNAPLNDSLQRVKSIVPKDQNGGSSRILTPEAMRQLIGEPLAEEPPVNSQPAQPSGKLREL